MRRFLSFVAISVAFAAMGHPQTVFEAGLVLNSTTPTEAIAKLGKPRKEKTEKFPGSTSAPNAGDGREEVFRLYYGNSANRKKMVLSFLKNKLLNIQFEPRKKTVLASTLPDEYQADFLLVEGFAKGVPLSTFEGQKETTVPKIYPGLYFMVAVKPDRYVIATVNNSSWKAIWNEALRKPTLTMFPGYVEKIDIHSRIGEK